jgi:hypothetical protein
MYQKHLLMTLLGTFAFASVPVEAFIKNTIAIWGLTRNSLLRQERCPKRGQGDVSLGSPPALEEIGGHPHNRSKKMKIDRISTEPSFHCLTL